MIGKPKLEEEWLFQFCTRWHVRRLSFFGSLIGPNFDQDSDVDVLVEFEKGATPGFFGIAHMKRELSSALGGREVDVRTPGGLSPYFRAEVMRSAKVQYAAS